MGTAYEETGKRYNTSCRVHDDNTRQVTLTDFVPRPERAARSASSRLDGVHIRSGAV